MMDSVWGVFCGDSGSLCITGGKACSFESLFFTYPFSCERNGIIICLCILLLLMSLLTITSKAVSSRTVEFVACIHRYTPLEVYSALYNGGVGLVYLGLGIRIIEECLISKQRNVLPLHRWLVVLFQGFTWLLLSLTFSLRGWKFSKGILRLCCTVTCLVGGILCFSSLLVVVSQRTVSVNIILDSLSLPGAVLLLLCTLERYKLEDINSNDFLYTPLNSESNVHAETNTDSRISETRFAEAGLLSKATFWWLNPLLTKGKSQTLSNEDIPQLQKVDRAESCYLLFTENLNKQKQLCASKPPSVLWAIVWCYWKQILISGFFALVKIVTLFSGPLLIKAFIEVAEGKQAFKYEGYVLAVSLFISKCIESLAQRQWYFRSRLIGVQVRSLLSAAIYKKQLRLSSAAKLVHSSGEITNYVTVDAYRIGEFPYWFHHIWTTCLQLCIALVVLVQAVGLATLAAFVVIILTVLCNTPLAKLQHEFQTKLMVAQDQRVKAMSEAIMNMKVLKMYAWETHFKGVIEKLRKEEIRWVSLVQLRRAYNSLLFWSSPVLVSAATFGACYFLGIPLYASNAFTFLATLRLFQDPVRMIPEIIGVVIQAKVAFARIVKFLGAPEIQIGNARHKKNTGPFKPAIFIESGNFSWEENPLKPTLSNINLEVKPGEKVAICGEVGAGKSTLLAAILGEVPNIGGMFQVYGKIAYVSQTAWIQSGSIRDNILFGCAMDNKRYQETLQKCSLLQDLEILPFGDLTEIGERGVNLSGGQKQRIQLARALYQDADIYLMDDPFSAVDAHTTTSLFNDYLLGALSSKTVLLVTHQVDLLPTFDSILLMSDGQILCAAPYHMLLASSQGFRELVTAHNDAAGSDRTAEVSSSLSYETCSEEITSSHREKSLKQLVGPQLIKLEEKEIGDSLKPYIQYLNQDRGFIYFFLAILSHLMFVGVQILQNSWMAANVQNPHVTKLRLIVVYLLIGCSAILVLLVRIFSTVSLGLQSSKSFFSQLLNSLFHAPMSFNDSTPLGRILSRVSSDLSILDLDVPFGVVVAVSSTVTVYANLGVLAVITWQLLFVSVPMLFLAVCLQKYYFASAKEFMRINGTTKSMIVNHLAESVAGAMTIRAFQVEDRFFSESLDLLDKNSGPLFHTISANEWLIQRLEILGAVVISSSVLVMVSLPPGTFSSGFVGMALSYALALNLGLVLSIQNQCTVANYIVSVERLNQYMHIPSEAPKIKEGDQHFPSWPALGMVEFHDLKVRYRPDTPLVLNGISFKIEGGHKIGIVGRSGCGKTTLVSALFRLVEPVGGKIIVDGVDISTIGLHDLRSRLGIIPQEPTLFNETVRYNLDPLSQYTDQELWEVLQKCQLEEAVQEKGDGLDSLDDGSNWSMGQRQLFCLGRSLLRRSRILVLDEATAFTDNATDSTLQKIIRVEFTHCTVITVAHRIPTVMDCTMVLALNDGKLMEYDEPGKLMNIEGSLFAKLVKEYWSYNSAG
ncbi:hypothetical protein MKW98_022674 [Papaver atlanticum]|uniref:ABC transporter C family member 10 n=1 Tax=Papaver atlanticum TaxID=357466 RepID=A0AAD4XPZ3_9MAGN|nr:hypothetical protein MKW98_022674 [Papaver atlanticum]